MCFPRSESRDGFPDGNSSRNATFFSSNGGVADLGLTGTKFGCGQALCGACTVIVDNQAVRSCATPVQDVAGKQVLTIEGLARGGRLHPIQEPGPA